MDLLPGCAALGSLFVIGCGLALAGLQTRASGRRQAELVVRACAARRRVRDVTPGPCTVEGVWRRLDDDRGLVEDESGAAVLVACKESAPPLDEQARVLVVGVAGGETDDPRGGGYRSTARVPRLAVFGEGHFVTDDLGLLDGLAARARRAALVGGASVAAGVVLACASLVVVLLVFGAT
jgi:hypothetical protein